MPSFEELAAQMAGERYQKKPGADAVSLWIEEDRGGPNFFSMLYGCFDSQGQRIQLGKIDPAKYSSARAYQDALTAAFLFNGVPHHLIAKTAFLSNQAAAEDAAKQERLQAFAEAILNSAYFRGARAASFEHYSDADSYIAGAAFGRAFGFTPPNRMREAPPPNPERVKALDRCRDLKRLRDSTTFPGEKRNAQDAMDRLQARHGIKDSEI